MAAALFSLVERIVRSGSLQLIGASGETAQFGDGTGERVVARITDEAAAEELARDPALKLGELYMDGRFIVEQGGIYGFLELIKRNTLDEIFSPAMAARLVWRIIRSQVATRLPVNRNRYNVSHHYDLNAGLFNLFLDEDWQYSCGYFEPPGIGLSQAQLAKKRHLTAKLLLEPGQKVLEIGSGWGGLALYMAESSGVEVNGITLSDEQLKVSRGRAEKRGLSGLVRFDLQDYRTLPGGTPAATYDRIVSVGMFEHVGKGNYGRFFRKAAEVLDKDGVMVLHSIGRPRPSYVTNPFIEKYIFPGGYIPAVGEVLPAAEKAGLLIKDVEILPMHYAETLKAWRERFVARKAEAQALYDERFFRMWEFYLAGSESAFRYDNLFVFQMQLSLSQLAVPESRNYIEARETALKEFEKTRAPLEKVDF